MTNALVLDAPCDHEWEDVETLDTLSCEGDYDIVLVLRVCRLCGKDDAYEGTEACQCKGKREEDWGEKDTLLEWRRKTRSMLRPYP